MFYTIKIVIQEAQFFIAGEFDMRVKSCEASDNQNRPIQLSDGDGCVLRPKMVSKFMKMRSTDPRATVVTYAFFHAFKFPDSMAVHIKCKVEICRYVYILSFFRETNVHSKKYVNFFSKILCSQLEKKPYWNTLFFESVFLKTRLKIFFYRRPPLP